MASLHDKKDGIGARCRKHCCSDGCQHPLIQQRSPTVSRRCMHNFSKQHGRDDQSEHWSYLPQMDFCFQYLGQGLFAAGSQKPDTHFAQFLKVPFHLIGCPVCLGPDTVCFWFGVVPWIRGPLSTPNGSVGRTIPDYFRTNQLCRICVSGNRKYFLVVISKESKSTSWIFQCKLPLFPARHSCEYCSEIKQISLSGDPSMRPETSKVTRGTQLDWLMS